MDYIQQAFNNLHNGWRYLLGLIIIVIAWQVVGAIPLFISLVGFVGLDGLASGNVPDDIPGLIEIFGNNYFLFLMLIMFVFGLIAVFLVAKFLHKQSVLNLTTARKKIDWKRFWFIFILWGTAITAFTIIGYYIEPESYEWNFQLKPFLILSVIAILLVPIQTSFEEYLFRGYLMQGIGVLVKNRWFPLIVTSVIFGLLHIFNPEIEQLGYIIMVVYIGIGFFLGIITLMDEGLELALGFHAANNLFTALLVTANWTAFQTDSVLKDISDPEAAVFADVLVPVFIVFPILLFILSKKYKWTNWKEKLFGNVVEPPKEDYKVLEDIDTQIQ